MPTCEKDQAHESFPVYITIIITTNLPVQPLLMTRKHCKNKHTILLYLPNTYQTANTPPPPKKKDSAAQKAVEDAVHVCQHLYKRKFCTDNLQSGSSEFYCTNVFLNVGQISIYSQLIIY